MGDRWKVPIFVIGGEDVRRSRNLFLYRRRRRTSRRKTMPPSTPPTMAATCEDLFVLAFGGAAEVEVDVVEVVI
jgi:hypothetical protein